MTETETYLYWIQHSAASASKKEAHAQEINNGGAARSHQRTIVLSQPLVEAIAGLCGESHLSFYAFFLAGFRVLYSRYTGENELTGGSRLVWAATNSPEANLARDVAWHVDISDRQTFREYLASVQGEVEHMLGQAVENKPAIFGQAASADLLLRVQTVHGAVHLTWECTAAMSRMSEHGQVLLDSITANPDAPIGILSLLSAQERHQVLVTWNDTAQDYPRDKSVHQLFEEQAERTPDALAVVYGNQRLTYRELNRRANRLAHRLRQLQVGPAVPVGICMERSVELVIGVLGILKAGGAYVPLDPTYPSERLAYMLTNSQAPVLLAHEGLLQWLPEYAGHVLYITGKWDSAGELRDDNPPCLTTPENPAYVIYTSGSTGQPKGVTMPHQPLVNLVEWHRRTMRVPTKTLQFTPISFDVAFQEIFTTWCTGATLVLVQEETRRDPYALCQYLADMEIDRLFLPFVALQQLAQAFGFSKRYPDRLRDVITAGEQLQVTQAVRAMFRQLPNCRLHNQYGPTETHCMTDYCLQGDVDQWPVLPPIGRPWDNVKVYLLDKNLQPVPQGARGEIYIGGDCLASGYLNRPDLTAERFIANPFAEGRLYKTGDLGYYDPAGNIAFLGRADFQVKIRGFRVELGEIEAVLAAHPAVREAVVVARAEADGEKRLVAYVVPALAEMPAPGELRAFLRRSLPDYMVPVLFVVLDVLPLTPSGKVDRRALPAPDWSQGMGNDDGYVPPQTPEEEVLCGIWRQVLKLDRVGTHDDFFELGGHSLLLTPLVSAVRETFDIDLPLRELLLHPTVASLAEVIIRIRSESGRTHVAGIRTVPRTEPLPLSYAQERMWFLNQLDPESWHYTLLDAIRLEGELQADLLEQSLQELLRRHESLRTTFHEIDGSPVQVVAPSLSLPLSRLDLSDWGAEERTSAVQRIAAEQARIPFDLATGPLLRATLLQLSATEHVLLLAVHHIISDGWSTLVLLREWGAIYTALAAGSSHTLPDLPVQYADFALWHRRWLDNGELATQLSYWKQKLNGAPPLLELPFDRPHPATQSFRGARHGFSLPKRLTDSLESLSREQGASLFMTLLAAFQTLLYRHTGQGDLCVASPTASRNSSEVEGLIGFFVNTLVLRTDLTGNPTFRTLLDRVRQVALEAYANQDVPFQKVVEAVRQERNGNSSPLFQVMFVLQNEPVSAFAGLSAAVLPVDTGASKFDITLVLTPGAEGFSGSFEYSTDLFEPATIGRIAEQFSRLLEGVVSDPDRPIAALPVLTDHEQALLAEWNRTDSVTSPPACVHHWFEDVVRLNPHAIAVRHEDEALTFEELNRQANQLAHLLREQGVGPDSRVVLYMQRTIASIVGLVGILKAGGAYVPVEPLHPKERLLQIVRDAQPDLVVTHRDMVADIALPQTRVICLDRFRDLIGRQRADNPTPVAGLENLAYVIYTSGSTGVPKGVAVEHRQLHNYLSGVRERLDLHPGMSYATVSTFAADLGHTMLFPALAFGGTLHIIGQNALLDPDALASYFSLHPIDCLKIVPSHLMALLTHAQPEKLLPRQRLILGGELLQWELVKTVAALAPTCRVFNHYGPTETTVGVLTYPIHLDNPTPATATVPIGRPIPNVRAHVLDANMQAVPLGGRGELYVGGASVSRGYFNRLDLTAERFVADPFKPGERLYRTGDLVRRLPNGHIEFLGRMDQQVKIRGFRVELGEIEATLTRHPLVRNAVVVADGAPGQTRLIAYVVPDQGAAVTAGELQEFARITLPEYMVPAVFALLDALPLNANGKVDRRALPMPEAVTEQPRDSAPQTATEAILADMMADILGCERVGVHANFFELGGHSLLATSLLSRIRKTFQVELSLRTLFASPTVAGMAAAIGKARRTDGPSHAHTITPVSRECPLPLSFHQHRLWFLDQLEPNSSSYNMYEAVRMTGPVDEALLAKCLTEIVNRHEILRTTFGPVDGLPVQTVGPQVAGHPLTLVDLSDLPEASREARALQLVEEEIRRPFTITEGPLLRTHLLRLRADDHLFVLTVHHIVSDGWSTKLLYRELGALYGAYRDGKPSPLSDLPIQYGDFAHWQRHWMQGDDRKKQLDYWRNQLADAPALLELPTDHPRPAVQTFRGATHIAHLLPAQQVARLQALSRHEGVTLFMTLLAAFQVLLYRYTEQENICVGTPVAGRNRSETEGLIGYFVNTLVLHTYISGDTSFRALLHNVREVALGAYEHQDVPFDQVVEALRPERTLSYSPLFQVMFDLQAGGAKELVLPGVSSEPLFVQNGTAKFDLTMDLEERTDGLVAKLEYSTDLFEAETAERILGHFRTLLEAVAAEPDRLVATIPMVTEPEKRQLLDDWNSARYTVAPFRPIHLLFEQQAERTPDAIAVVSAGERITYSELNRRVNKLAHYLRTQGVVPDQLVGVCLNRSATLLVGVLGIMKAGGAYLPLDPAYPAERLAVMLEDARPRVILSERLLGSALPECDAQVLCVDGEAEAEAIAAQPDENPRSVVGPENMLYVIFTSGSTGRPKGVIITHGNLAAAYPSWEKTYQLTTLTSHLQMASVSFDVFTEDVVRSLCAGARLVLCPRELLLNPGELYAFMRQHAVDSAEFVPAVLRNLAAYLEETGQDISFMRLVISGADSWYFHEYQYLLRFCGTGTRLINSFGVTEATIDNTCFEARNLAAAAGGLVPIGRPFDNVKIYILDAFMQPVPVMVRGEVYIGGSAVAPGYLNRPDLTAERFIPDPFSDDPDARLYRTGDVARFMRDGNIEFLGRGDNQVKVRGFRIELGEVESALRKHPQVREAVVVAREFAPGDKRLVAYIVPNEPVQPHLLQRFLRDVLPEYMVPAYFVPLDSLPLTANGKVNRKGLPAPDGNLISMDDTYVAPQTPLEIALAQIWAEVLGLPRVGISDNFWELGGHSLLTAQVVTRVRDTLGIEVPLRALFVAPTIALLSDLITQTELSRTEQSDLIDLLEELENLSEEEADKLLGQ